MSFYEDYQGPILCQICMIPFDIARIRTLEEGSDNAWGCYAQSFIDEDSAYGCRHCSSATRVIRVGDAPSLEHIAGFDCKCYRGYSGHRITTAEMAKITHIQCLEPKSSFWKPEPRDEDFDLRSRFCFVTGISVVAPEDQFVERLRPKKHRIVQTRIANEYLEGDECAIPIHPQCLEFFKRLSFLRLGRVDIDRIWKWRKLGGEDPRGPSVDFGKQDLKIVLGLWYRCLPGTEYLVADPVDIPGLHDIFATCIRGPKNAIDLAFLPKSFLRSSDPFRKLPAELRWTVISTLSKMDVANLRSASAAYAQLPQSYFRNLVLAEMPWVWEVRGLRSAQMDWCDLWCKLSRADGGSCADTEQRASIWQEDGENNQVLRSGAGWSATPDLDSAGDHRVLKGLRNRRRIYYAIQHILDLPANSIES